MVSPNANASWVDRYPDSEREMVASTTSPVAPESVNASEMPFKSASKICWVSATLS